MIGKPVFWLSFSSAVAQLRLGSPVVVNYASQQPFSFAGGFSSTSSSTTLSQFQGLSTSFQPSSVSSSPSSSSSLLSLGSFNPNLPLPATTSFGPNTFPSFQPILSPSSPTPTFSQTLSQSAQMFPSFNFGQAGPAQTVVSFAFPPQQQQSQQQPQQQQQRLPSSSSSSSFFGTLPLSTSSNRIESAMNVPQPSFQQQSASLQFPQSSTPISQQQFDFQVQQQQLFAQSFNQQPQPQLLQTASSSEQRLPQAQFVLPNQQSNLSFGSQQQTSAISSSLASQVAQYKQLSTPQLSSARAQDVGAWNSRQSIPPSQLPSRAPTQLPSQVPSQLPSQAPSQAPSPLPLQPSSRPRAKAPSRQAAKQAKLVAEEAAATAASNEKTLARKSEQAKKPLKQSAISASPPESDGLTTNNANTNNDDEQPQLRQETNNNVVEDEPDNQPDERTSSPPVEEVRPRSGLSIILPTAVKHPSPDLDVPSLRAFDQESRTTKKSCVFTTCANCSEAGCQWQAGMCKQQCSNLDESCYFLNGGRKCPVEPIIVSCIVNIPMNCRPGQQAPDMGALPYPIATGAAGEVCVTVAKHYCIPRLSRVTSQA